MADPGFVFFYFDQSSAAYQCSRLSCHTHEVEGAAHVQAASKVHSPCHPLSSVTTETRPDLYRSLRLRMELEMLERRDRELRERDLSARIKVEEMMRARQFDPHWLDVHRWVAAALWGRTRVRDKRRV